MVFPVRTYLLFCCCLSLFSQTSVLTQHNDLARTGQNLSERLLTPANVSSSRFGKAFALSVDGLISAQPLYMPGLSIGGQTHNVVFVATEHDSVYAFDADSNGVPYVQGALPSTTNGPPLWQASLLDAAHGAASGATPDPAYDTGCYNINGPEYGITGTPVIDAASGTLYVVSLTYENNYSVQRLHALDIKSGAEKFGGPVTIAASLPGTGAGSSGGMVAFDPRWESQRAGLALVNGNVYIGFAAHCDFANYHGWLFAYNASTLAQTAVFLTSPNGVDSGIWMGAAAPAVDTINGVNRMFVTTGNGTYDATTPYATNSADYGDDILRLDLSSGIHVADAFTPLNQAALSSSDTDLGSSGALILPDQAGAYPHLLLEASKGGAIYLVNRDNLGGYSTSANNVVQELDGQVNPAFGLPAYWNGNIYLWASGDSLKQFGLTNGQLSSTPLAVSAQTQATGVGSTPSISANGTTGGVVWSLDPNQTTQVLYAHDATNVANLLWSSAANAARDSAGNAVKFGVPTVANGKVYVGSTNSLIIYALPDFVLSGDSSVSLLQGGTAAFNVNIGMYFGLSKPAFAVTGLPAGVTVGSFVATSSGGGAVGQLSASANATPGTYQLTVTGTDIETHSYTFALVVAAPPDFGVASSPTSLTLSPGTSATTSLTVSPLQSFNGAVSFTCSVAASLANVTCSVPGTVSGGSGSATLTVTAAAGALSPHMPRSPKSPLGGLGMQVYLLTGLGTLLAFMLHRRRRALALAGIALVLLISVSCAGPSSSVSSTSSTSETGLITVVGTSGSLSHSITISVSVN